MILFDNIYIGFLYRNGFCSREHVFITSKNQCLKKKALNYVFSVVFECVRIKNILNHEHEIKHLLFGIHFFFFKQL